MYESFFMTLFLDIFLVKHIFNILLPLFPIWGSCSVKMAQKYYKSTYLACFDLKMSESFFITLFYDIFLVEHIFNIFLSFCHSGRGGGPSQGVLVSYRNYIYDLLLELPSESSGKNLFCPFLDPFWPKIGHIWPKMTVN